VSFATALTPSRLRSIAGQAFVRGLNYFREGRVARCDLDGDTLEGRVVGGESYHVRVSVEHGDLVADCTCPVGTQICKHAVALLLYHLDRVERGDAAAPERARDDDGPTFATRAELERFAAQHHVGHALSISAEVLAPDLPGGGAHGGMRYLLGRLSVRDVASREGADRFAGGYGFAAVLAQAGYRALHRAAAEVSDGIAEEATRGAAPLEPTIAALWDRLVELRAPVRRVAFPRSRAARATGTWSHDARAFALFWREAQRVHRTRNDYGSLALVAQLAFPGDGVPRLECTCGAAQARCAHVLALLDATLDVLADPAREVEAREVAAALLRPGWARALDELDGLEAGVAKARAVIEVWWRIEVELGGLTLTPVVKKQARRGGLTAGARTPVLRLLDEHRAQLGDDDLRVAEALLTFAPTSRGSTYPTRAFVALVGHPRVVTERDPDLPVEVVRVPLGFSALPADEQIRIEPSIEGARLPPAVLASLVREFAPGEPLFLDDPDRQRCLLIDVSDDARQLWSVLEKHGDTFPPESHAKLLDRLARMEHRMPLSVPRALKGIELATEATTVLRLRLLPDVALEVELLVRPHPSAPLFQPGGGPEDVLLVRDGERAYVRRDLSNEPAAARAVLAAFPLGAAEEGPAYCFRIDEPDTALALVAAVQAAPPGVEVEWVDRKAVVGARVGADKLKVTIDRKRDWFGIEGEIHLDIGRLELAVLLDAARRQQRFVRVDADRWVELSDVLRQRLLAVSDQTYAARGRLELSPGAVPAVSALAEAGATVDTAAPWRLLGERLAAAQALMPKPPAALAATLRDYQIEGHAWLSRLAAWGAGACLADDMGLGKTVQAIAVLIDRAPLGPALVLAPTSVAYNWVQELRRFAPGLTPRLYADQADRAACLTGLGPNDVVIVSYGLLVRDAAALAATTFATLVVDEAQAVKNPSTRRARAARDLDAGFRIALSGTPFENHLGELWSLFSVIFPGLLGSWEQFRERYAAPIERARDPDARAALSRVLRPFLLRRTKQEVARELPARTEIQVPVALSEDEWAMYEDARLAAVAELDPRGKSARDDQRFQVLAALTRLRLLASHPKLYDPRSTVASSKLRRLLELLEELRAEGHRVLVFSQFTSHLGLVREALDRAGFASLYLDGGTPARQRATLIEAFQAGEAEVFLISLKAGGTGINLTNADYVIHLDPWWNPAVEDQATDRAHRIGQTRPVTVFRLITRGTIEEQIVAMHHDKRALVSGVLDGTDVAGRLTTDDLLALLAGSDRPTADDEEGVDPGADPGAAAVAASPPRRRRTKQPRSTP